MGRNRSVNRSSAFYKKHTLTRYTVKEGEKMAVWNRKGQQKIVTGPKQRWVIRARVTFLDQVTADQNEYLVVTKTDGSVEHKRGPFQLWVDPVKHRAICVNQGFRLEEMDAIVVHATGVGDKGLDLSTRIVKGPTLFFPAPNETIATFSWHGEDPSHKTRLIPGGRVFSKLKTIPEQFYFNVHDVRTADDALITVKFMVFYQLTDINKMLATTTDPIQDFMNALCSDTVVFGSSNTFEEILTKTAELGDLSTFPSLIAVALDVGFRVDKVVYRGYQASETLQKMHNTSITERNNLKLRAEKEQQDIELVSHELDQETEMVRTSNTMALAKQDHEMAMADQRFQSQLKKSRRENEAELARLRADTDVEMDHLAALKTKGVELTPYLLASLDHSDKVIKIEHGRAAGVDSDDDDRSSQLVRGGSQVSLQIS